MQRSDVIMIKPSDILSCKVQEEFSIPYPISWADAEKDGTAWIENRKQKNAFRSVQRAQTFCTDTHTWRYLQISDHFYYMSCKHGSCGEVHSYFSHQPEHEAFIDYMNVLADFEEHSLKTMKKKKYLYPLRSHPVDDAFYFSSPVGYTGQVAFDLDQFAEILPMVPSDSIVFHIRNGDFSSWCRNKVGNTQLASIIEQTENRQDLMQVINTRTHELWAAIRK